MRDTPDIFNSGLVGFTHPVAWQSPSIDLGAKGSSLCSFHIYWRDVGATFYLWRANGANFVVTSPPWNDFTVAYRTVDLLWADPAVADPLSEHIVSFQNVGARYVKIGYTAGNWVGANHMLEILLYRDRIFR